MAERQATIASSSGLHARPAKLFVQAVQNVDIPIMSAYLLLVAAIFVTINLVVDLLYTVVDPRLRTSVGRTA